MVGCVTKLRRLSPRGTGSNGRTGIKEEHGHKDVCASPSRNSWMQMASSSFGLSRPHGASVADASPLSWWAATAVTALMSGFWTLQVNTHLAPERTHVKLN